MNRMNKKFGITVWMIMLFVATHAQTKLWTMKECVDHALENNLAIELNGLNVKNSEIDFRQSKASLYPTLGANGNYGYNWGRSIDPTSNDFISQRIGSAGFNASSSVVLFSGMSLRNQIKQNKMALSASEFDLEKSKNDVTLDVLTFYLNIIFNKELVENSRLQLESTNRQLDRTIKLVEAGALPKSEKLNLVSQKATNQTNLISSENRLVLSVLGLKQLLRIPANEVFDIATPEVDITQSSLVSGTAEQVYSSAENNQPDIKSADLNSRSMAIGEEVAKSALLPTISASGGLSTNYSSFLPTPFADQFLDNRSTFLGVNMNIPVFTGLQNKSNIQRATLNRIQAEINAEQARQLLRQTIEQAYYDAQAASKSYDASLAQVEALDESFRIAKQQRDVGALNFVDYQLAENNLFQAKSDLVRNKYDYIFKVKVLDFYQGNPISF